MLTKNIYGLSTEIITLRLSSQHALVWVDWTGERNIAVTGTCY